MLHLIVWGMPLTNNEDTVWTDSAVDSEVGPLTPLNLSVSFSTILQIGQRVCCWARVEILRPYILKTLKFLKLEKTKTCQLSNNLLRLYMILHNKNMHTRILIKYLRWWKCCILRTGLLYNMMATRNICYVDPYRKLPHNIQGGVLVYLYFELHEYLIHCIF